MHKEDIADYQVFKNAMDILCQRRGNECFNKFASAGKEARLFQFYNTMPFVGLFEATQSVLGSLSDLVDKTAFPPVWI